MPTFNSTEAVLLGLASDNIGRISVVWCSAELLLSNYSFLVAYSFFNVLCQYISIFGIYELLTKIYTINCWKFLKCLPIKMIHIYLTCCNQGCSSTSIQFLSKFYGVKVLWCLRTYCHKKGPLAQINETHSFNTKNGMISEQILFLDKLFLREFMLHN